MEDELDQKGAWGREGTGAPLSLASPGTRRSRVFRLGAILLLVGAGTAAGVRPGDSQDAVLAELGPPDGRMEMGSRTLLTYERGEVVLEDGVVVEAELISAEQAAERRSERAAAQRQRQEEQRLAREQRKLEGMEVRARKLGDTAFMNASAAERVAYWRSFQESYPDVALGEEYTQALREYELELEAKNAAAEAEVPPAPADPPQPVYAEEPYTYSSGGYYTTYGDHVRWYGSRLDPVITRPPRSHAHDRPSYGYGYQEPIETPSRPQRPVRPRPLPALRPAR